MATAVEAFRPDGSSKVELVYPTNIKFLSLVDYDGNANILAFLNPPENDGLRIYNLQPEEFQWDENQIFSFGHIKPVATVPPDECEAFYPEDVGMNGSDEYELFYIEPFESFFPILFKKYMVSEGGTLPQPYRANLYRGTH